MANIKAKKKNIKRIKVQTERNIRVKSRLKTLRKKVTTAESDEEKKQMAVAYTSALDKALKHGIMHKNKVNRHKAQVANLVFAKAA